MLAELEERLANEDQGLARRMRRGGTSVPARLLQTLLVPIGLALMLTGVNLGNAGGVALGVGGYVLMLAGALAAWQLRAASPRERRPRERSVRLPRPWER